MVEISNYEITVKGNHLINNIFYYSHANSVFLPVSERISTELFNGVKKIWSIAIFKSLISFINSILL